MTLLRQIQKGFRTAGAQVRRFGKDVSHFIGSKVLPVVGKIASGVSQGIKYAMPAIGMIAPELLPVAMGAGALASTISSGVERAKGVMSIHRPPSNPLRLK